MATKHVPGLTLKALREALTDDGVRVRPGRSLTQAEVAAKTHRTQTHISGIERGAWSPSKDLIADYAFLFGVTTELVAQAARGSRLARGERHTAKIRGVHARKPKPKHPKR